MAAAGSSGLEDWEGTSRDSSVSEETDDDLGRATRTASSDAKTEMEGSDEGDGVTDSARHDPEKVQRHRTKRIKMRIRSIIFMGSFSLFQHLSAQIG
jgi:hypothetical protein